MKKRGQLSVFIIVAVVIAVASLTLIVLWQQGAIFSGPIIGKEAMPLKRYVETCLSEVTQEGIFLLESQAGYIDVAGELPDTAFDPSTYLDGPPRIPLWYHSGESRIPSRKDMADELTSFVQERLDGCLGDFALFRNQLDIEEMGGKELSIAINDGSVAVTLDYPLRVTNAPAEKVEELTSFSVNVPTTLGKLHELAALIMLRENRDGFLEMLTNDMIATSEYLPYEGIEVNCKPRTWSHYEIEEYMQELVATNVQYLSFHNTYRIDSGIQYYDNLYTFSVTDRDFSDVMVQATYDPSWDMQVDVRPRKGDLVRAIDIKPDPKGPVDAIANMLLGVCIKLYHHKYSVEYPLLFTLRDQKSPADFFLFATPVILTNNLPDRQGIVPGLPDDIDIAGSREYCADQRVVSDYQINPIDGRIIVYENQVTENGKVPLQVQARDYYFDAPLRNISISYQCARFRCPEMGYTEYPMLAGFVTGGEPRLEARFPQCLGGYLIADHPDYHRTLQQQSVLPENANEFVIMYLPRLKRLDFGLRVLEKTDTGVVSRDPNPDEEMLVIIENEELDYERYIYFPTDNELLNDLAIPIGDFNLSVQVRIFRGEKVVGGADYVWSPDPLDVVRSDFAMFFAIAFPEDIPLDPQSEEWLFIAEEAPKHKVKLL
ncbi:MAG: hypothetical protein ABIC95_05805 [archaeon]